MLKLHHMNLLNEIQETTLMMNLYQQQQLQQQQQQLQQQANGDLGTADSQMAMLLQQNQSSMDPMFGAAQLQQQRNSLGLGGAQLGGGNFGGGQQQSPLLVQSRQNPSGAAQSATVEQPTAATAPENKKAGKAGKKTSAKGNKRGAGGKQESEKRSKTEENKTSDV
jgi:hypothetical protein